MDKLLQFDPITSHTHTSTALGAGVVTLTAPVADPLGAPAGKIMIQTLTQNVRYTLVVGATPTSSVGFQLKAGDIPRVIPVGVNTVIKVIREADGAVLQYQWAK